MRIHEDIRFQGLIDRMEYLHREGRIEEMKAVLEDLQILAEAEQDDIGLTAAYFYRDILYGGNPGSKEHMQYAKKALIIAEAKDIPYYRMKLGNTLGIMCSEISDFHTSLEYYLSAINIAEEHPEYAYAGIVLNNIGNLFVWLEEYEEAVPYLERAYHKCIAENQNDRELIALVILNLIEMYSNLDNYEKVKELEDTKIIVFTKEEQEAIAGINLINNAKQLLKIGQVGAAKSTVRIFVKGFDRFPDYTYLFRCYLNALKLGIAMRDFSICSEIVEKMEAAQNETFMTSFSYDYAAMKVQYYETFKEEEDLQGHSYYDEYYKESQKKINQLRNTYTRSLTVKIALEEAKSENLNVHLQNERLQKDVERDIFTNLYNKVTTQKYVREAIKNRCEDKKQALIVIDIDLFKRINDNYGHGFGDKVISAVAGIIDSVDEKSKIAGRFGGDEFLLFLDRMDSVAEIEHAAQNLLERVRTGITLPDDRVKEITLSVGICVLKPAMSFEEAFARADEALYKAKELGRNQYILAADKTLEA